PRTRSRRTRPSFPTRRSSDLEAEAAVVGIDLDRGRDAQAAEEPARALDCLADRRGDVVVDRLRERGGEACLRRRLHQVAVRDEQDRKSTRLNSSHQIISYAVF